MIDIAIITTPRRPQTIDVSIESIRNANINNKLFIFAEPGCYTHIDCPNTSWFFHKEKKGCFTNYDYALRFLLENTNNSIVCVCTDDVVYHKSIGLHIADIYERSKRDEKFGYYALHTRAGNNVEKNTKGNGWNVNYDGWHTWHGIYVMRRDVAKKMIAHDFYVNHLNYGTGMNIDAAVSETLKQMGLTMFYYVPSLSYTVGIISTINHHHPYLLDGYKYDEHGE